MNAKAPTGPYSPSAIEKWLKGNLCSPWTMHCTKSRSFETGYEMSALGVQCNGCWLMLIGGQWSKSKINVMKCKDDQESSQNFGPKLNTSDLTGAKANCFMIIAVWSNF